jgi:hypothetical protein
MLEISKMTFGPPTRLRLKKKLLSPWVAFFGGDQQQKAPSVRACIGLRLPEAFADSGWGCSDQGPTRRRAGGNRQ